MAAAVKLAEESFGKLDVMFNNAGIMHSDVGLQQFVGTAAGGKLTDMPAEFQDGDSSQTTDDVFDLTMNINVKVH